MSTNHQESLVEVPRPSASLSEPMALCNNTNLQVDLQPFVGCLHFLVSSGVPQDYLHIRTIPTE